MNLIIGFVCFAVVPIVAWVIVGALYRWFDTRH